MHHLLELHHDGVTHAHAMSSIAMRRSDSLLVRSDLMATRLPLWRWCAFHTSSKAPTPILLNSLYVSTLPIRMLSSASIVPSVTFSSRRRHCGG
jgi:hypothetical protein